MAEMTVQQDTASGPGQSLPQGGAAEVNANLPTQTVSEGETLEAPSTEEMAAAGGEVEDTSEPELAEATDYEPVFTPEADDEVFLTGPTTRPDESVTTGAFGTSRRGLPADLVTALPMFEEAASMPGAPIQLQLLMAALAQLAES